MTEDTIPTREELVQQNEEIIRAIESVPQQLEQLRQQLAYNTGILKAYDAGIVGEAKEDLE